MGTEEEMLRAYVSGEMSCSTAMSMLGRHWPGVLLRLMADYGLQSPRLADEVMAQMAQSFRAAFAHLEKKDEPGESK